MQQFMKQSGLIVIAFLTFGLMGYLMAQQESVIESAAPARDGVFIHISSGPDDPHRVLMALSMAKMMSEDRDVLVYFDIDGIQALKKDAEDVTYAQFDSLKSLLGDLLDKEVPLQACPGCMAAADVTLDDLMEGVQQADKDAFFNFTSGRILTLDY